MRERDDQAFRENLKVKCEEGEERYFKKLPDVADVGNLH